MIDRNDKIYIHSIACVQANNGLYNYIYDKLHRFGLFVLHISTDKRSHQEISEWIQGYSQAMLIDYKYHDIQLIMQFICNCFY